MQNFLVPDSVISHNGVGPEMAVSAWGGAALITLGILEVVEQEILLVGVYGSRDGAAWEPAPLIEFPEKFYPGVSAIVFDPARYPEMLFIRPQWKTSRWGRGSKEPRFRVYIFAQAL